MTVSLATQKHSQKCFLVTYKKKLNKIGENNNDRKCICILPTQLIVGWGYQSHESMQKNQHNRFEEKGLQCGTLSGLDAKFFIKQKRNKVYNI